MADKPPQSFGVQDSNLPVSVLNTLLVCATSRIDIDGPEVSYRLTIPRFLLSGLANRTSLGETSLTSPPNGAK